MKDKLGFDVDAAIKNSVVDEEEVIVPNTPTRRAAAPIIDKAAMAEATTPVRRATETTEKYKIISEG